MAEFQFNADPKTRGRRAAIAAAALLVVGGLGWLVWSDWTALDETRGRIVDVRGRLDRATADLAKVPATEDAVLLLRETVKEYVKILPNDKEINAFVNQLTRFAQEAGVRVTKLDDADAKSRGSRAKKGPVAAFDKVVYRISLEGLSEPVLRFMDLFENHERFVRIASLKMEAERQVAAKSSDGPEVETAPAPHRVDLELETYVYDPKSKSQGPVDVPGEAQKLERLRAVEGISVDARRDLALASYKRTDRGDRRDVLLDPRRPAGGAGAAHAALQKEQEAAFAALKGLLDAASAAAADEAKQASVVKRLKAREETERRLAAFDAARRASEERREITLEPLRKRVEGELLPAYEALAAGRDLASRRTVFAAEQATEALERVRGAFAARRFDEVVALAAELTRRRTGEDPPAVAAAIDEAESLAAAAAAEVEFDGRAFSFGGTVVYRQDAARSVAIINGRPYMPGDRLDEETSVVAITSSEIAFEFRGRRVVRSVKAAAAAAPDKRPLKADRPKKKT